MWRIFCELWVVLFGIHDELVSVRYALNLDRFRERIAEPIHREEVVEREETVRPREVVVQRQERAEPRHTGVLGLS